MTRTLKLSLCSLVALIAVVPAASAQTGTQTVTALADAGLSLSVPATVVTVGTLKAGQTTNFTPSAILVVDPTAGVGNAWTLNVKDATNAGRLQKTGVAECVSASAAQIANPLTFAAATTVQTSGGGLGGFAGSVAATDVAVASGISLADTVTSTYSVAVPAGTALAAACPYTTTLTYTLTS